MGLDISDIIQNICLVVIYVQPANLRHGACKETYLLIDLSETF